MRKTDPGLRAATALALLAALSAFGASQVLRPAGAPRRPQIWEGGRAVAFLSPPGVQPAACWSVQAIVVPVSKPAVVEKELIFGTEKPGKRLFLAFDVRASVGLEPGRTYHCLAPLDYSARASDADRYLLMGWRASGNRLAVETQTILQDRIGRPRTSVESGDDSLFVAALLPTSAKSAASHADRAASAYLNLAEALKGAAASSVRQITGAFAALPEVERDTTIEGGEPVAWIRRRLFFLISSLPQSTPVERFRYGGLLASWDRPRRALDYLKALPALYAEIGLGDAKKDPLAIRRPGDAQDDHGFLGRLNLVEGIDPDLLFGALWNTPLRAMLLDPNVRTAPSLENQRRVAEYFNDPEPDTRAKAYSNLAAWYADWPRLSRSQVKWSDTANGPVIEGEAELREYWEKKLGIVAKP